MVPTMTPETTKLVYTPEEAAAMLDISRTTIYELIKGGDLRAVRVNTGTGKKGKFRIPKVALDAYLGGSSVPSCDNFGCERPVTKRMELARADGHIDTYVCDVHWALDYEGRLGPSVQVHDLTTDTQEVSN